MEDTLGKRIVHNRKRLGLTQDQLADRLGVTAQAVSKWENDQSCPDITTLPRLAALFGITTDELLGVERIKVSELVEEPESEDGSGANWEFHWDAGRRSHLVWALGVLAVGVLVLLARLLNWDVSFWNILWPVAVMTVGLSGGRFSFFGLGCLAVGGYFLLDNLHVLPGSISGEVLLPGLIILFGVALLVDALKKPRKGNFSIIRKGSTGKWQNEYSAEGDAFTYNARFGESVQAVDLQTMSRGEINTSFGDFTVDFSRVEAISHNCVIEANCSFGELKLLMPRRFAVRPTSSTAFAQVDVNGKPDSEVQGTIAVEASVSFGEITIEYIS